MSWQATAWAAKQVTGSPARKLLLLALANYADPSGMAYPSQDTLAADTEQSRDTVQRQLKQLVTLGLVRMEKRVRVKGEWPGLVYFLSLPVAEMTEPQIAARSTSTEPHSCAARSRGHRAAKHPLTVPQNTPSPCRTAMRHEPIEQLEQTRASARGQPNADVSRMDAQQASEGSKLQGCDPTGRLGAAGEALVRRIGADRFASWFSRVELVEESDGAVILSAPTRFIRDHITAQFGAEMDAAWSTGGSTGRRLAVVVAAGAQRAG